MLSTDACIDVADNMLNVIMNINIFLQVYIFCDIFSHHNNSSSSGNSRVESWLEFGFLRSFAGAAWGPGWVGGPLLLWALFHGCLILARLGSGGMRGDWVHQAFCGNGLMYLGHHQVEGLHGLSGFAPTCWVCTGSGVCCCWSRKNARYRDIQQFICISWELQLITQVVGPGGGGGEFGTVCCLTL